ncbi:hypothetical protein KDX40_13240 [Burkholderia ambifaria]|uniref:hypothetical protein n=1 Tax=Burkholderia ambifaria TaxID=152480 RepID=UPI001B8F06AD|nr:hypothetical protein [Burkholderia ambifaria]MBR8344703.1 hypothetical protein [Burkholderia ambifaria]
MTHDEIMVTASYYSEVDAHGYVRFCEDDLINFAQSILAPLTEVAGVMPAWIDVNGRRPTANDADEEGQILAWNSDGEFSTSVGIDYMTPGFPEYTHWMPLPGAPLPPSADAAAAPADGPSELDQVVACLGDDAATLRHADQYTEMADNMETAARLLESCSAILADDRAAEEMCNRWPWQREASQPAAACARTTNDRWWDQALHERDTYEEYADELAHAIAAYLHIDIGENSNFNNPWLKALEAIKNAAPPAQVATRQGLTDEQWEELRRIARTYNEQGFPKHAREFFARALLEGAKQ